MGNVKRCSLGALFIGIALCALAQGTPPQSKHTAKEKYIHLAIPFKLSRMYDPVEHNHISLQPFFRSIYATLFRLDTHLQPYPFYVDSYSRNGKEVTFQLKQNARFSDGSAITAEDVVYSLQKGICGSLNSPPLYQAIQGGEAYFNKKTDSCTGIEVVDNKRFKIRLSHANVKIDTYLTSTLMSILPSRRSHKTSKILYSGPYRVVSVQETDVQSIVTLKRNRFYLGKTPRVETVYFHFYNNNASFQKAIATGQHDMFLLNQQFKMPDTKHNYNYFMTPIYGAFYFKLNAMKGPFRDHNLRHFFCSFLQTLDLQKELQWTLTTSTQLILPHSLTGYSVFQPLELGNWQSLIPQKQVTLNCAEFKTRVKEELLSLMKRKLKQYNIQLNIQWLDHSQVVKQEKKGDIDLTSYFYLVDVPLTDLFYKTLFTPGSNLNSFGYSVPGAQRLLKKYDDGHDVLTNLRVLSALEKMAQDEAFVVPLMAPLSLMGYRKEIKNAKIDKYMTINFEDIDVKKRH